MSYFSSQRKFIIDNPGKLSDPSDNLHLLKKLADGSFSLVQNGKAYHSLHNSLKEARRQADSILNQGEKSIYIFIGGGLAYAMKLILEETNASCFWIEPDPVVLSLALYVNNFSDAFETGRLTAQTIFPDDDRLETIIKGHASSEILFVNHRGSENASSIYFQILEKCKNFLDRREVNRATMARFDRAWARNIIFNYPVLRKAKPVSFLFASARGKTAIVCGAGPSLDRSLEDLESVRNSVLLICVDTALHVLTAHRIDPDIIVCVDPQTVNRYYLEGYAGKACIVIDPAVTFHIPRHLSANRIYFSWSPFPSAAVFFDCLDADPGKLAFGGSVSTNAYDLAVQMGCTKIYLIGQDFAFTGGKAHCKGAILEERLNLLEKRTFRRETHNFRQLSALPVRYLPSKSGSVPTNDKLLIFHRWFNRRIPEDTRQGIDVANATEGGAILTSARSGNLSEIASLTSSPWISPLQESKFNEFKFQNSLLQLESELRKLIEFLKEAVELSRQIRSLVEKHEMKKDYFECLNRLDELDAQIRVCSRASEFAGAGAQKALYSVSDSSMNLDALKNADQSILLYSSLLDSAEVQQRWMTKSLKIMKNLDGYRATGE